MSLMYAGLSVFTGGLIGYASWGDRRPLPSVVLTWLLLLSPIAVFSIQTFRVLRSLNRTRRGQRKPRSTGLWSLDVGMQWKFLLLQLLSSTVLPPLFYRFFRLAIYLGRFHTNHLRPTSNPHSPNIPSSLCPH